ncbi:MAG: hypothetical protein LBK69_00100 [Syntrophomonadaceae bacterium]|jgi:hypothetical protein|nr:hypothetical protein [Syntrophomonadaceae bacterium]
MKEAKRYSIGVTISRTGSPNYKFSDFTLQFLNEKLAEFNNDETAFKKIRAKYKKRNK